MHFFVAKLVSVAKITYTYVHHVRNLRPVIRLIYYAQSEKLACVDALSFDDSFLANPCEHYYQKQDSLNYMTGTITWVYLYFIVRYCFRNPRKEVLELLKSSLILETIESPYATSY